MTFVSSVIVVEDVLRSRALYESLLHLKVTADFGLYNVGFEGGLSLYRKAFLEELIGRGVDLGRHHNLVLYFEVDDLEALEHELAAQEFEFIHQIREQPWKQRTFRFYDYDNHILEVGERMHAAIHRLKEGGCTLEEISNLTGYPEDQVVQELEKHAQSGQAAIR